MSTLPDQDRADVNVVHLENEPEFAGDIRGFLNGEGVYVRNWKEKNGELDVFQDAIRNGDQGEFAKQMERAESRFLLLDLGLNDEDWRHYQRALEADADNNEEERDAHLDKISGISHLATIKNRFRDLKERFRVIVLSKFDDKLLVNRALHWNAFAFVTKYRGLSMVLDLTRRNPRHELVTRAHGFFQGKALAREIRDILERASVDLAMGCLRAHVPRAVAQWAMQSSEESWTKDKVDASLLLMDIRGSTSLLSKTGVALSGALFRDLLNIIFRDAIEMIHKCGGEVNTFTGDGLLALFNVYKEDPRNHLRNAASAALRMREAFSKDTIPKLESMIGMVLMGEERKKVLNYIRGQRFGVRIGIAGTDRTRSIVTTIGSDDRKMHTIVCEQVAALRRALDCTGQAERAQLGKEHKERHDRLPAKVKELRIPHNPIILVTRDFQADRVKTARNFYDKPLECDFRGLERKYYLHLMRF